MKKAITIQELASRLGGKAWEKGDLRRVYLEKGHNTKKMSTKCYVYESNGAWRVSVNIDCPSQPAQWIDSQEEELRDRIEDELRIALAETFYYIEVEGKPVDEDGKAVESVSYLYMGDDLFTNEVLAGKKMAKREIDGTVKAIDRSEYDAIVAADRKAHAAKREEDRLRKESLSEMVNEQLTSNIIRAEIKAGKFVYLCSAEADEDELCKCIVSVADKVELGDFLNGEHTLIAGSWPAQKSEVDIVAELPIFLTDLHLEKEDVVEQKMKTVFKESTDIDMTAFSVGSNWEHPKFGVGEVLSVEGGKVNLKFSDGVKMLLAKFAPLTPVV